MGVRALESDFDGSQLAMNDVWGTPSYGVIDGNRHDPVALSESRKLSVKRSHQKVGNMNAVGERAPFAQTTTCFHGHQPTRIGDDLRTPESIDQQDMAGICKV